MPDTKTIIKCKNCGWFSLPLDANDLRGLGVPWYCEECSNKVEWWVKFEPGEEDIAREKYNLNE